MLIAFAVYYFFCIFLFEKKDKSQQGVLIFTLIILTFMIGFRGMWPDKGAYLRAFQAAPTIDQWGRDVNIVSYSEAGYFYLAGLVKTIWNNEVFYLTCMGAISMCLLYRTLNALCAIPLLGLCDYIARFLLNRDFTQMRSSLAILIIILGIKFIYERKIWKYSLCILIAYQFHHMALIGLPFYFFNWFKYKKWHLIVGIIMAMILSQTFAVAISGFIDQFDNDLNITTYTTGDYVEQALKLRNPMIYYQIGVLMVFAYCEKWLKGSSKYYYLYRNAYFYSTLILIFFCNYTALSGRTSTLFATCEMFILPMIANLLPNKSYRNLFYFGTGIVLFYFFYSKYGSATREAANTIIIANL